MTTDHRWGTMALSKKAINSVVVKTNPRGNRRRAYASREIRMIIAFFQEKPWSTGAHLSPFLLRRVEWMNPIAEKKQMATPARKGMNPVPGDAGVPSLYCREPRHTAKPRMNQTVLLSWSLFNASLLFDSQHQLCFLHLQSPLGV
jgi:hypothetical protein